MNNYEGNIDVNKGNDWNQSTPPNTRPSLTDLGATVTNFFAWEFFNAVSSVDFEKDDYSKKLMDKLSNQEWSEIPLGELFNIQSTGSFNKNALTEGDEYDYVTRTSNNQGILQTTGFVDETNLMNLESGVWGYYN